MRVGDDGRLYAINLEAGFFGVARWTSSATNAIALPSLTANTIFTNTALTVDGDVSWEGLTKEPPGSLTEWRGQIWSPELGTPAARPDARFAYPAGQCPAIATERRDSKRVPISAIHFGGRRATTAPLVTEAFDAVFLASNAVSEGTAVAETKIGAIRRESSTSIGSARMWMAGSSGLVSAITRAFLLKVKGRLRRCAGDGD